MRSKNSYLQKLVSYASSILISRIAGIVAQVISIPLITSNYNSTDLSIWLLISTIYGLFMSLDLGFGSHVINKSIDICEKSGFAGLYLLFKKISRVLAIWMLALIGLFVAVQVLVINKILSISPAYANFIGADVTVLVGIFALLVLFTTLGNIAYGIAKGYLIGLYQTVSQIVFMGSIFIGASSEIKIVELAVVAYGGMALISSVLVLNILFKLKPWQLVETKSSASPKLKESAPFFTMQLTNAAAYNLDSIFIAKMVGIDSVSEYLLTQKIFLLTSVTLSSVLSATWPLYREELSRSGLGRIKELYHGKLKYAVLFATASSILTYIIIDPLFDLWTNGKVEPNNVLTVCFAAWTVLNAVGGSQAMLMNGTGQIAIQAKYTIISSLINLSLTILLTHFYGVYGPILASIITVSILYMIYTLVIQRFFKESLQNNV